MPTPPSSINSSYVGVEDSTSTGPTSKGPRYSFGTSNLSLSRFRAPPEGTKPPRRESYFRNFRGPSEPPGSTDLGDELRSEISSNSSASQLRSIGRSLAKTFDRLAPTPRAGGLWSRVSQDAKGFAVDPLDLRGRDLGIVIDGALGVSEILQDRFFDKHRKILEGDERARDLEAQNARIRKLDHQMFTTMVFYGDNGAGKSSLIDALLDHEFSTPISDNVSCTTTPIEFRARNRKQNMNERYTVIADILTGEEWLPVAKNIYEKLQEDSSDPMADAARDILRALFGSTKDDAPFTLEMIQRLPLNFRVSTKTDTCFETTEIFQLQEHVKKLEDVYWPILRKITIYMDSPVLNTGVVLVDLPDLKNINPMKRSMTESYLKDCKSIFVVSNISLGVDSINHILSDPVIQPIVRQAQLDSSKISFILTQTDNMKMTTRGTSRNRKEAIQKRIEETRQQFKNSATAEVRNADTFYVSSLEYQWSQGRLVRRDTGPCLGSNDSGVPNLRGFIQQKGLDQREAIAKSLFGGHMKIFVNSIQGWCDERNERQESQERQERQESQEVVEPEVGGEIENLKKRIPEVFDENAWKPLTKIIRELKDEISEAVIGRALESAETEGWSTWKNLNHQTFGATARRDGEFDGSTLSVNWNYELAAPLIQEFEGPWQSKFRSVSGADSEADSESDCRKVFKCLGDSLRQETHKLVETIDHDNRCNTKLLKQIVDKVDQLIILEEKEWNASLRVINQIFTDKSEDKIKQKMSQVYKKCSQLAGDGVQKRRVAVLRANVPNILAGHYEEVRQEVFEELDKLIKSTSSELEGKLEQELASLGDIRFNYLPRVDSDPATEGEKINLSNVICELLTLSKVIDELEERAGQPQTPRLRVMT